MRMKPKHEDKGATQAVTLRQVAAAAGVSPSTASSILNEAPRAQAYAEATRKRVRMAAAQLGYSPNLLARTLKRQESGLLGVVMFGQDLMYHGRLLLGAEETARAAGYDLMTTSMGYSLGRFDKCLQTLAAWRVEGVILLIGGHLLDEEMLTRLRSLHVPFVSCGLRQGDTPGTCTHFNTEAGRTAAQWLLQQGHSRIAVLGASGTNLDAAERVRGVEMTLLEHGLSLEPHRVVPAVSSMVGVSAGYAYAATLLRKAPDTTAVLAINDVIAIGAMRRLTESGLSIPQDISLIGFDDICLDNTDDESNRLGLYLTPALTTVRVPLREMGSATTRLLVDIIEGCWNPEVPYTVEFAPKLIVRNSAGPVPVRSR
jgi:LacI family transcriptional regulator